MVTNGFGFDGCQVGATKADRWGPLATVQLVKDVGEECAFGQAGRVNG